MDLPKRKSNRLQYYDYSSNGAYFITICTKDNAKILCDIVGDDAYIVPTIQLTTIGNIVEKYVKSIPGIDKYVIMPNHIHLIICIKSVETIKASSPTQSIPQLIRSFKTLVTKDLGSSVFQRSFHDHIIRNKHDYDRIWEYIDTNPIKWKNDCFYK